MMLESEVITMALIPDDIQWGVIKAEYVAGQVSCQDLCEKYDVPPRTMQDRCRREGWTKLRKEYRKRVVDGLLKKQEKEDIKHLSGLRTAATSMAGVLKDISAKVSFLSEDDSGLTTADTRMLRDVVMSLRDLTATIRDLYGIPNVEEASRMRVAEERLELERQRLDNGDDASVVTVIMAGSEDYAD